MQQQTVPACTSAVPPAMWFCGLDLGQASDFTALAVIEKKPRGKQAPLLELQMLKRWDLGTSYPQIVADVLALLDRPARKSGAVRPLRGCCFGLDATGVGRAIVDMFRTARPPCQLLPVTITGGNAASFDCGWRVPKADLVAVINATLQTQRLGWDRRLPFAELLGKELSTFETRLSAAGNEQFGTWREGQHDDLVLAVAIAVWLAERAPTAPGRKPMCVPGMVETAARFGPRPNGFQL